jgi:hypothetical protein
VTTKPKERAVNLRDWEARAIVAGVKTQLRVPVKPQPEPGSWSAPIWYPSPDHKRAKCYGHEKHLRRGLVEDFCPFRVGDVLRGRETWRTGQHPDFGDVVWYGRDQWMKPEGLSESDGWKFSESADTNPYWAWKSCATMPRWACRIFLTITRVRVERVQDISHHDALAEGVAYDVSKPDGAPLARFRAMWDARYGPGAWERNDWVWVIDFARAEGGEA